ncbi:hypothetical protein OHC33_004708 [Knufia fluminis]|uniref:FAD/NAD(P)-binding domain-containing protein n=1 Tax=Knufia fluminis TaxID=191047 RepID=A0AAN8EUQ2_9EURO|nr:hypothetical protein OHC33_004708 [Knufia fluminis]
MSTDYDLVVVGAGWFGLAAAKVYLELHPIENILVLESSGTCGGTWAENRIYPGLKSNNLHGTYEYPDFPMDPEVYRVRPGEHIPGDVLHRVDSVEPAPNDTWKLQISSPDSNEPITTGKLILATGLTSTPNFPQFPGVEKFQGPYFHAKDFARYSETVKTADNVVVIGGAKSAYDVAYTYADSGVQVDLIIRPDGHGPVWISNPYVDFGLRLEKLLLVRFLTCFSPCPFGDTAGLGAFRNWLHGTRIGRWLVDKFWVTLGNGVIAANGYASHPEIKKLQPWNSPFWTGTNLSIYNYPHNFNDLVKQGKTRVHIANVDHLTEHEVHLSTGDILKADVVVCATGWDKKPPSYFDYPGANIGLPQSTEEQTCLIAAADNEILTRFPRLRDQPQLGSAVAPDTSGDPHRLYRFIVPPNFVQTRNLAFAGALSAICTAIVANSQALWISAFFDGKLDRLASTDEEITREVLLHTQWGKWRYPCGYGAIAPDLPFDALPYVDLLHKDLGLRVKRKANWFWELFEWYGPEDFGGLVDEWVGKHPVKEA